MKKTIIIEGIACHALGHNEVALIDALGFYITYLLEKGRRKENKFKEPTSYEDFEIMISESSSSKKPSNRELFLELKYDEKIALIKLWNELIVTHETKENSWTMSKEGILNYLKKLKYLKPWWKIGFYFIDGTGFVGNIKEFSVYCFKRFQRYPFDSFEIYVLANYEEFENEEDFLKEHAHFPSGALYPPDQEGPWDPTKGDDRFK